MKAEADFRAIYDTDLVYLPGCWKLCGDAHCCSFARHKARFRLIGAGGGQELPLLPGEYAFLSEQGWLDQFGPHQHRRIDYDFAGRRIVIDTIVSKREGCVCSHATRPTICRLYPLLPVFDIEGRMIATEMLGIHDALAEMEGLERLCQVDRLPFGELNKLLRVAAAIAQSPLALFYMTAYRLAHDHVKQRLGEAGQGRQSGFFQLFEMLLLRGRLFDRARLDTALSETAERFEKRYGAAFALG